MLCGGCCYTFVVQASSLLWKRSLRIVPRLMHSTAKFFIMHQGDFYAVQRYPYLASPSFCWTFVASGILGCFLAMVYPSVLNLELVNLNITGLAKVVVSAVSVISFGVPVVPRDYLFWTALSLVAGIFVPRRSTPCADSCTFAQAHHSLEHI